MHRNHQPTDHFRNARVFLGDEMILDGVEGYLSCREKSSHRKEWHGYFMADAETHMEPGIHYRLVLADGRSADINAGDIRGCESLGGTHAIEFYVVGDVRHLGSRKYGLDFRATRH